jgi:DNA-binding response OmpR family regulator
VISRYITEALQRARYDVVDTHVLHLRQKVEADPAEPTNIRGVRVIGYRLDG